MSPEQDAKGEDMVVHVAQGADMRQSEQSVLAGSDTTIPNDMQLYGNNTEIVRNSIIVHLDRDSASELSTHTLNAGIS